MRYEHLSDAAELTHEMGAVVPYGGIGRLDGVTWLPAMRAVFNRVVALEAEVLRLRALLKEKE